MFTRLKELKNESKNMKGYILKKFNIKNIYKNIKYKNINMKKRIRKWKINDKNVNKFCF